VKIWATVKRIRLCENYYSRYLIIVKWHSNFVDILIGAFTL